ncbi:MAG: restriction endonuclease subunit S [Alphaproteobacteria bacterium]|nr:restriction endonuclease subunit S [Alphaproteobacteria bacterium]
MSSPPNGWVNHALREIADLVGGGTPSRSEPAYFGGGIPWVTPTDLPPIGTVTTLGPVAESITNEGLARSSAKLVPAGSVLYSSRASIGKIAVADRPCSTNQGFANFVPRDGRVDSWFLAYLLCRYTPEITGLAGTTTFKEVSKKKLGDLRVPVPPAISEQRRIVARIDELMERVDEVRDLRAANLATSGALLPALLKEQFAGINGTWPSETIGAITAESRYGTSEKCSPDNGGTPVLRIPNVADRRCNLENLKYLPHEVSPDDRLSLAEGDILVVRTNGSPDLVGRCAVVPRLDRVFGYASYLIRLRLDAARARPRYVAYFLSSTFGRDQISKLRRTSAGQFNINGKAIASIKLPLPPLPVQDELIDRMDRIDASVRDTRARLAAQADRDSLLPAAILRKAFAGEL